MPMKLNVGLNRKVGEPNYGSRGASVHFEVEVESDAVRHPQDLHEKIRYLFALARQAVDEELQSTGDQHNGNGRHHANGNQRQRNGQGRAATESQMRALRAICDKHGIDLAKEVGDRFPGQHVDDLTLKQASELIDALKDGRASAGGRR